MDMPMLRRAFERSSGLNSIFSGIREERIRQTNLGYAPNCYYPYNPKIVMQIASSAALWDQVFLSTERIKDHLNRENESPIPEWRRHPFCKDTPSNVQYDAEGVFRTRRVRDIKDSVPAYIHIARTGFIEIGTHAGLEPNGDQWHISYGHTGSFGEFLDETFYGDTGDQRWYDVLLKNLGNLGLYPPFCYSVSVLNADKIKAGTSGSPHKHLRGPILLTDTVSLDFQNLKASYDAIFNAFGRPGCGWQGSQD